MDIKFMNKIKRVGKISFGNLSTVATSPDGRLSAYA
jgi:hypothetical protein